MIRIVKWEEHQHYKNRRPPWIKLYRSLLDKRGWREASSDACKLLVDLWLLASEGEDVGTVDMDARELAWRLRLDAALVVRLLNELEASGFIEWKEADGKGLRAVQ